MNPDVINAAFEIGATAALSFHVQAIVRAKRVLGVSIVPIVFYQLWGGWNLFYYPALGQSLSFAAGVGVFAMNSVHVCLMLYYRVWPGGRSRRPPSQPRPSAGMDNVRQIR